MIGRPLPVQLFEFGMMFRYDAPLVESSLSILRDGLTRWTSSALRFCSESGGADTLSRIQRGLYDFPEQPALSAEAKEFMSKVRELGQDTAIT